MFSSACWMPRVLNFIHKSFLKEAFFVTACSVADSKRQTKDCFSDTDYVNPRLNFTVSYSFFLVQALV